MIKNLILILKNSGWEDLAWRKHVLFYTLIITATTLCFCGSMFFSYHTIHPDEYYQIIEFASAKMGISQIGCLPWEYFLQIRSWIQPGLFYLLASGCAAVSITDPFFILGLWSTFSALLLFVPSMILLFLSCNVWIKQINLRFAAVRALALFWLMPYIGSHPSSEMWGMCVFSIAFAWISLNIEFQQENVKISPTAIWIGGLFLGIAFQLRFHTAFLSLGLIAWLLYKVPKLEDKSKVFIHFAGSGILTLFGFAKLDAWGYESPGYVTSFINYFQANVTNGISKAFGVESIFWYLHATHNNPAPYLSILLMGLIIFFWILYPKHLFTWISLPFFLIHCFVPHKEIRFLIPLIPFCILSACFLLQKNAPTKNPFFERGREKLCALWDNSSYKISSILFWTNQWTCFVVLVLCFGHILSLRMVGPRMDTWIPSVWNKAFEKTLPQTKAFFLKIQEQALTKKGFSFGVEMQEPPYSTGFRGFIKSKRPNWIEITIFTLEDLKTFFSKKENIIFPTFLVSGIDLQKHPELLATLLPITNVERFPHPFLYKICSFLPVVKNWVEPPLFLYSLQVKDA